VCVCVCLFSDAENHLEGYIISRNSALCSLTDRGGNDGATQSGKGIESEALFWGHFGDFY